MSAEIILSHLARVKTVGSNKWIASCPTEAHKRGDRSQGLSVTEKEDGIVLMRCHAGCETGAILSTLGLSWADLYPPKTEEERQKWRKFSREKYLEKLRAEREFEMMVVNIGISDLQAGKHTEIDNQKRLNQAESRIAEIDKELKKGLNGTYRPTSTKEKQEPEQAPHSHSPPTIEIRAGEIPLCADKAQVALMTSKAGLYQRGTLCRITRQKIPTVLGIKRPDGMLVILPVDESHLLDLMDRNIEWLKYDSRKKKLTRKDAPLPVAKAILSRVGLWPFPLLTGVISAPTLRPDGSLLDQPGYDVETGLMFDPLGTQYPPIPLNPTREQGSDALTHIKHAVLETPCSNPNISPGFPFRNPCSLSAALSAILTGLVRKSLPTAPMTLINATRAGSGKTLLADVIALIVSGTRATQMSLSDKGDEDEQEKRLLAVFAGGDPVVSLDNIEGTLGGKALAKMLTCETFTGRILGQSKTATYPASSLWLATGNGIVVREDLTRRVVLCELDPQVEKPEHLAFQRNLTEWVPQHRGDLVADALTALRAYVVAGKPHVGVNPYGSFEDWSALVRNTLIWLGEIDPLESVETMEAIDPVRKKLSDLMVAWYSATQIIPDTCASVAAKALEIDPYGEPLNRMLRDCLVDHFGDQKSGKINTREMGEFIQKYKGRIELGARFEFGEKSGHRVKWKLNITDKERFIRNV